MDELFVPRSFLLGHLLQLTSFVSTSGLADHEWQDSQALGPGKWWPGVERLAWQCRLLANRIGYLSPLLHHEHDQGGH